MSYVLFFVITRLTPSSTRTDTLFPYTTLFQSVQHRRDPRDPRPRMGVGIAADPFGAGPRLAEPASRQQHPDVPVALRRTLIVAPPPGPVGPQFRGLVVAKPLHPRRIFDRRHVQQFGKPLQSGSSLAASAATCARMASSLA